jgi:RNA polymerase sigma factor (sigma-70 family)
MLTSSQRRDYMGMGDSPSELQRRFFELLAEGRYDAAFEVLYRLYEPSLTKHVRQHNGPADTEELMQEIWLAARSGLPSFASASSPGTWLFAIAKHKQVDWVRKRQILYETLDTQIRAGGPLASALGFSGPRTPASIVDNAQMCAWIAEAMQRHLTADDTELIRLRFVDGMLPAEIAQARNRAGQRRPDGEPFTAGGIAQRIHRALELVRGEVTRQL